MLYGLCKIHKTVTEEDLVPPFRPILSAIETPTYNLAKFFVPILKPLTENKYSVKDSFSFCKDLSEMEPKFYMTSFDMESLFTNIPLDEAILIALDLPFQRKKKVKGLLRRHCKQLLTHAVKSSSFISNNVFYQQIDGVLMGSPLGPTLANLFLA